MPLELDPDEVDDEPVAEPPPEDPEACVDGLEDCVDEPELEDCVDEPELEEFEPQAATPSAASTSRAAASRRVVLVMREVIVAPVS